MELSGVFSQKVLRGFRERMRNLVVLIVVGLLLFFGSRSSHEISFGDIADQIGKGVGIAKDLLKENGEVPRGKGCVIKWNIEGKFHGFEWKWMCTCVDVCTGIVEVQTKSSREGAMEHCFSNLYSRLGAKGEL